nr:HepT-like ribonuclease domain-containing protein [Bradyrhizobium liaoningense]
MPPTVEDRLLDILEAITDIEGVAKGLTFDQFVSEKTSRLAIERLLEIVCEASRFIPDEVKRAEPGIDWRKMIDFGNLLRQLSHDEGRDRVGYHSNPPSAVEVLR